MSLLGSGRQTYFASSGRDCNSQRPFHCTRITKGHKMHLQWEGPIFLSSSRLRLQRISIKFGMSGRYTVPLAVPLIEGIQCHLLCHLLKVHSATCCATYWGYTVSFAVPFIEGIQCHLLCHWLNVYSATCCATYWRYTVPLAEGIQCHLLCHWLKVYSATCCATYWRYTVPLSVPFIATSTHTKQCT
jgi:hypothetical protein